MCFIIWNKCNPCQTIQSIHGTCNTKACYIKLAASDNSTIFHSITEHTDFPAESPQIQFLIENSTKLLAHELTMLNANTDIELYYISVTRRCNCSWQGLLHFFSFFSSFDSVMLLFKPNSQWQKHPVIIFVGFRMHPIRPHKQYFCFIYWLCVKHLLGDGLEGCRQNSVNPSWVCSQRSVVLNQISVHEEFLG